MQERKKIAGAFVSDHMLHYVDKFSSAYEGTPVFALIHTFQNREDTQSGLGPMDAGLSLHVQDIARKMDTYLFILGDHGVR